MPTVHANRILPALKRVVLVREIDRTDGQLLAAFIRDRDGDAFAALVRRHGAMVLGVCRRVTGNADAADDAFQAVFLILARRAGSGALAGAGWQLALRGRVPNRGQGPDDPGPPPVPRKTGSRYARTSGSTDDRQLG